MNKITCYLLLLFSVSSAAQQIRQASWKQQVNYTIQVTLQDDSNYLHAFETIEYFNNAPLALPELYVHLYMNAFSGNSSAYARQQASMGKTKYLVAEEKERGFVQGLEFKVGADVLNIIPTAEPDIILIRLREPLAPGKSIKITTPFKVKLPYTFSRPGHVEKTFQISQWFPKIAVYDVNGWNPLPYLDQGEFYSDYGNYDVTITLPRNYLVAATGNLQTAKETDWLKKRAEDKSYNTAEFDSIEMKTIRFTEENVHDFAWFADKKWCVAMEEVALTSGKKVMAYAFDKNYSDAEKGVGYIRKTLQYLTNHVGEYPYQTAKACTGALVAGAGMEYPTVTIVGAMNEPEVVHEVGHNWFYGILGSQERVFPWMDEGVNTFYQLLICDKKSEQAIDNKRAKIFMGEDFELTETNLEWFLGLMETSRADDAEPARNSEYFSDQGYGVLVYYRTAKNFLYLKNYLGEIVFDACMKKYFAEWHHRHPLPGDIRDCFEKVTGTNMEWFFVGVLKGLQNFDISVKHVDVMDATKELTIQLCNKTEKPVAVPVKVSNIYGSETIWVAPFRNDTSFTIPNKDYTKVEVNANDELIEVNTKNNRYLIRKAMPKYSGLEFRLWAGIEHRYRRTCFISLAPGYNAYNKYMLGLAFYNSTLVRKHFEYLVLPMYSFSQRNLNGYLSAGYTFTPRGKAINTWTVAFRSAKFDSRWFGMPLTYTRLQPYLQFNFAKPSQASMLDRFFRIDLTQINEKGKHTEDSLESNSRFLNVAYHHSNDRAMNPYRVKIWFEKNLGDKVNDYWKVAVRGRYAISYRNPKHRLTIDGFLGAMRYSDPVHSNRFNMYLAEGPVSDYKYWRTTINRDRSTVREIYDDQGGMRTNILNLGFNSTGFSVRLRSPIPGTNLIRPYIDLGSYKGIMKDLNTKYVYTTGISFVLIEDAVEVHFPLCFTHQYSEPVTGNTRHEVIKAFRWCQSGVLNNTMNLNDIRYGQTITVLLNLDKLAPLNSLRKLSFGK